MKGSQYNRNSISFYKIPYYIKSKFKTWTITYLQVQVESLSDFFPVIKHIGEGSGKIPPRKIPIHQTPSREKSPSENFPLQKIPTWNITTHFINCLSSLKTSSINGLRESLHVHPPPRKQSFDISRTA